MDGRTEGAELMCDHAMDEGGREGAMVAVQSGVHCDPCLGPLIRALAESELPGIPTRHGPGLIRTVASCCGHGRRPGRVTLADGQELLVMTAEQCELVEGIWPGINDEPATTVVRALPDRETIARALYLHSYDDADWDDEEPPVREVYLRRADAVLALFGQEDQR